MPVNHLTIKVWCFACNIQIFRRLFYSCRDWNFNNALRKARLTLGFHQNGICSILKRRTQNLLSRSTRLCTAHMCCSFILWVPSVMLVLWLLLSIISSMRIQRWMFNFFLNDSSLNVWQLIRQIAASNPCFTESFNFHGDH